MSYSYSPVSLQKLAAIECLKLCERYAEENLAHISCEEKRIHTAIKLIIPEHLVDIVKERYELYKWIQKHSRPF